MICYSTFCDEQFICLICSSVFVMRRGGGGGGGGLSGHQLNRRQFFSHLCATLLTSS